MKENEVNQKLSGNFLLGIKDNRYFSLLSKITGFLFRKIELDIESKRTLQEYSGKGIHIFASFHSKNIALLLLYNVLKRGNFDTPIFALGRNPFFNRRKESIPNNDRIEKMIKDGMSIYLNVIFRKFFNRKNIKINNNLLEYLIAIQRKIDSPVYLFQKMIFWNMNQERSRPIISSNATGDRDLISGWITVIKSFTPAFVRVSKPINLKDEIEKSDTDDTEQLAIRIANKLVVTYDHNKRIGTGPLFKSRKDMKDRVLNHKNVLDEIEKVSKEDRVSVKKLNKKAAKYYKEIASKFSIVTIKYFIKTLDYIFGKLFDGVGYDVNFGRNVREASKRGTLVFVPCHKSHMDYLILGYILYKNSLIQPQIAAGINLSFFGVGSLFRYSGAFFMRRTFKGLKLYPVVFKQYLKTLISEGNIFEFFIEGGRSRTGRLGFPKIGLLSYLIEAVEEGYTKDLIFMPVTVNYERILEENSFQQELNESEKDEETFAGVIKARKFLKKKHGKVYVAFDGTFSYNDVKKENDNKDDLSVILANIIINRINEAAVVTPYALAATVMLLLSKKGFSRSRLKKYFINVYDYFNYINVNMSDSLHSGCNVDEIIEQVIESFLRDNILEELSIKYKKKTLPVDDFYILREGNRVKIDFYKNCIIQYLLPIAFVSLALLKLSNDGNDGEINEDSLASEYAFLKDLFSKEFVYSDEINDKENSKYNRAWSFLAHGSIISEESGIIRINDEGNENLNLYSRILVNFFESYNIVLNSLPDLHNGKIDRKEFIFNIRKNGIKRYHLGETLLVESLSTVNYNNVIKKLVDLDIIEETYNSNKSSELKIIDLDKSESLNQNIVGYMENVV